MSERGCRLRAEEGTTDLGWKSPETHLGDITGLVPDHHSKANFAIKYR